MFLAGLTSLTISQLRFYRHSHGIRQSGVHFMLRKLKIVLYNKYLRYPQNVSSLQFSCLFNNKIMGIDYVSCRLNFFNDFTITKLIAIPTAKDTSGVRFMLR